MIEGSRRAGQAERGQMRTQGITIPRATADELRTEAANLGIAAPF